MAATTAFLLFILSASLLLNLYFLSLLPWSASLRIPTWAGHAAAEAEEIAAIPCSSHGQAFLDGVLDDGGQPVCECHRCYGGSDCSTFDNSCPADLNSGDPLYLEPYWRRHATASAILISGWHRMSYQTDRDGALMSQELERHIRLLHQYTGNAVTEGRYIVLGIGSTQLLNAAVHALSPDDAVIPASVVAAVPYYSMYKAQTEFFNDRDNVWGGAASSWTNFSASSLTNLIEFVTSPNNPDGFRKKPVLNSSSVIYDHAYYWPHYTAIKGPADGDVMLFTMSKVSGHAGSRLGWAVIKEEEVYNRVSQYVLINNLGISRETQLRILKIIKAILGQQKDGEGDIFGYGHGVLRERWRALKKLVNSSDGRFSLPLHREEYCSYFDRVRAPSPAYAWLKCEKEEEDDCYQVLYDAGIISREGSVFGDSTRHTRLSLLKSDDDFEHFMSRFRALVSEGNVSSLSKRIKNPVSMVKSWEATKEDIGE